jgi:hypothetical protein
MLNYPGRVSVGRGRFAPCVEGALEESFKVTLNAAPLPGGRTDAEQFPLARRESGVGHGLEESIEHSFGHGPREVSARTRNSPQVSILPPAVLARPLVERRERLIDPKKPSMPLLVRGICG